MIKNAFFSRLTAEGTAQRLLCIGQTPRVIENALFVGGNDATNHETGCVVVFDDNDKENAERSAKFFSGLSGCCLVKHNYKEPRTFQIKFVSNLSIDEIVDKWLEAHDRCEAEYRAFIKCMVFNDGIHTYICGSYLGKKYSDWAKKIIELSVILELPAVRFDQAA